MAYGGFVWLFDVLIIPFLRDSTSLEKIVRPNHQRCHSSLLDSHGIPLALIRITGEGDPSR